MITRPPVSGLYCHQSSRPESQRRVLSQHFLGESTNVPLQNSGKNFVQLNLQFKSLRLCLNNLVYFFQHNTSHDTGHLWLLVSHLVTGHITGHTGPRGPASSSHNKETHQDLQTPASSLGRLPLNIGVEGREREEDCELFLFAIISCV